MSVVCSVLLENLTAICESVKPASWILVKFANCTAYWQAYVGIMG